MNRLKAELGDLLAEMAQISALSGHEEPMARYLAQKLRPSVQELYSDRLGNVIGKIEGRDSSAPTVMVFAHLDQLGFVIRRIREDGLIQIERLGGIPEKVLPGLRVSVLSEEGQSRAGVIGVKSHHAARAEEKYEVIPYAELYVDIGASRRDEVTDLGIQVGCPVVYAPHFEPLLGDRVSATSVDDRGGCAVLIKLAERLAASPSEATVYLVGTVQEEFNLRGAKVAAQQIRPEAAIALDIVVSCDTPDLKERSDLRLGGGAVIGMYSFHGRGTLNGTLPHPELSRLFLRTAREETIPIQRSANLGSLTDSSYVQLVDAGIACIDLGFPARYTHTPVEICDLSDLEALLRLSEAGLRRMNGETDFTRLDAEALE